MAEKELVIKRTSEIRFYLMIKKIGKFLQLTKPSIMLLVIFTGSTSLVVEGTFLNQPLNFVLVLVGLFLTGGSANALNQYFERNIDANMTRTSKRRPLPQNEISPTAALIFSITIGIIGVALFWYYFNLLTAMLSLSTILFYSLFYTLWLKPNTSQNIVIGGIAGSMAPVGAWTAATGQMDFVPWILFAIIFFWTPPHFWSLALFCKEDYKRVNLPMMPVVKGDDYTYNQMIYYTLVLFVVSLSLLFFGGGWLYLSTALYLGYQFIKRAYKVREVRTETVLKKFFGFSLVYLFGLFTAILIDGIIPYNIF